MDQESRRTVKPSELTFGNTKYLQMAMFMCLLTNEEVIEQAYSRKMTDCIFEDQQRYIAQLERSPQPEESHNTSNEISATSELSFFSDNSNSNGNANGNGNDIINLVPPPPRKYRSENDRFNSKNSKYKISRADQRKLLAASTYARAKQNKLLPEERDQPVSLSTLSSMRTTFGIFSASDILGHSDHGLRRNCTPSYDSRQAKEEMEDDLNLMQRNSLNDFCGGELFGIYDDIRANTRRAKKKVHKKSKSLNNSAAQNPKHPDGPTTSCPDHIERNPLQRTAPLLVENQNNSKPIQTDTISLETDNNKRVSSFVVTNKTSPKSSNLLSNLSNNVVQVTTPTTMQDLKAMRNTINTVAIKRSHDEQTHTNWNTPMSKLPKLVATNNLESTYQRVAPHNQSVVAPQNQRVIPPHNQSVVAPQNQRVIPPHNQSVVTPQNQRVALHNPRIIAPQNQRMAYLNVQNNQQQSAPIFNITNDVLRSDDNANEDVICANIVQMIRNNPQIDSTLSSYIDNLDFDLEILLSMIEPTTSIKVNDDDKQPFELEDSSEYITTTNPKNYNFELILNDVVRNNFCEQSIEIEKIVASHSSSEFHSFSQRYSFDIYCKLKEFRRKVRNKYAARVCRLKRLNESELLKQRNDVLNDILGALKFEINRSNIPHGTTTTATNTTAVAAANRQISSQQNINSKINYSSTTVVNQRQQPTHTIINSNILPGYRLIKN